MKFRFDKDDTIEEFRDYFVLVLAVRIGDRLEFDFSFFIDCCLGIGGCASPLLFQE